MVYAHRVYDTIKPNARHTKQSDAQMQQRDAGVVGPARRPIKPSPSDSPPEQEVHRHFPVAPQTLGGALLPAAPRGAARCTLSQLSRCK